jgi:dienelactone hydrolase
LNCLLKKLLLIFLAMGLVNARAALPVDAYFQESTFEGAVLSPSGQSVAFLVRDQKSKKKLAVLDIATMKPAVIVSLDEDAVWGHRWVNDTRLTFQISSEYAGSGLFAVDKDGENFRQLVETLGGRARPAPSGRALAPQGTWLAATLRSSETDDVIVARYEERSKEKIDYIQVHRLNNRTGQMTELDVPKHVVQFLMDGGGNLRAATERVGPDDTLLLANKEGALLPAAQFKRYDSGRITPRWVDQDGTILVEAHAGKNTTGLHRLDPLTGALVGNPIVSNPEFDFNGSLITQNGKLIGAQYDADGRVTQWLEPQWRALQAEVDKRLPRTANHISVPTRGDANVALIRSASDRQPNVWYLIDTATMKLTKLGASQPHIEPKEMAEQDFERIPAQDGLIIPTYITYPPNAIRKNLPAIVLVHGGPWVRGSAWGWSSEAQFLASRGYVVIEPQFRGSTGFGSKHFTAGVREWGGKMQQDLADVAQWASTKGVVDAKRVCIAGGSYGGYAATMGLVTHPNAFRCAVSWVGVTDIELLFSVGWSDMTGDTKRYSLNYLVGDPEKDAEKFKSVSVVANAAQITQPVLLAYGELDRRVPLIHGEKLRDALKSHNKNLEWITYPNEGHGWWRLETRVDFWARVERFLTKHNPARM